MERLDYEAVEAVETQLDAFIERRARERDDANKVEAARAESERRAQEKRREINRWLWIDHHDRLSRQHLALAADHDDRRSRLLAEADQLTPPDEAA